MNFHEPLEIKFNFLQFSSPESPLASFPENNPLIGGIGLGLTSGQGVFWGPVSRPPYLNNW